MPRGRAKTRDVPYTWAVRLTEAEKAELTALQASSALPRPEFNLRLFREGLRQMRYYTKQQLKLPTEPEALAGNTAPTESKPHRPKKR